MANRRYSARVMLALRPKTRRDLERIAAELDAPLTEVLRDWIDRCIQSHDRQQRRAKARPAGPEQASNPTAPADRQGSLLAGPQVDF